MDSEKRNEVGEKERVMFSGPMPVSEIGRYNQVRDPDSEVEITRYVEIEAQESVQHVEKIRSDFIVGQKYEVWNVITDKKRWWVITNLTNLYPQDYFRVLIS
jgi:hypothetical protein